MRRPTTRDRRPNLNIGSFCPNRHALTVEQTKAGDPCSLCVAQGLPRHPYAYNASEDLPEYVAVR